MSKKYTKKTAALKATKITARKINSKNLSAEKILLNGENLEEKIPTEAETILSMITRCKVTPEDNYILYTDDGNIVYCNLKGYNRGRLFMYNENLTDFTFDMSEVEIGDYMFFYASNLTSFRTPLSSLTSGVQMFVQCNLDSESIKTILTSIPEYNDNKTHQLSLTIQKSAASAFNEITGNTSELTSNAKNVLYKGWTITINTR